MKNFYTLTIGLFIGIAMNSQSFSDDFESYSEGDYIGVESDQWTTWSGATGGAEDAQVVTDNVSTGENAIYFSSTSATGGPQDVVLPFGDEYNLGEFLFELDFYVESGNGGYFNFQANEDIGEIWAMDCYMVQDGMLYIGTQGVIQISTGYDLETWNNLSFIINLTTNNWEVILNDETIGVFSNEENQIASIDLFPVNQEGVGGNENSSFWIDNISYSYTPYELQALNLGVISNSLGGSIGLAGQTKIVSSVVRNLGTDEITSFDIEMSYNGNDYFESVSGVSLESLEFYTHDFDDDILLIAGENDLVVTISNINGMGDDNDDTDDVKILSLDPVVPAAGKIVICEEATGTWCPWCPRGAVMMDRTTENYPEFFAGIAVHNGDPMTVDVYDSELPSVPAFSGYPGVTIDRRPFVDPLALEGQFLEDIQITPAGLIENGAIINTDSETIEVSLTTTFQEVVNGNWKIACVLVEDGVTGTGSSYAQANNYAGGGNGEMGGYEDLANPVPASAMVYDHVARAISPAFTGYPNAFPDPTETSTEYIFNFQFPIEENWDLDNMVVIGMIIEPSGGINNGSHTSLNDAVSNGFENGTEIVGIQVLEGPDKGITLYPNPTNGLVNLQVNENLLGSFELNVFDGSGKLVLSDQYENINSQTITLDFSAFENGIYMIQIQNGTSIITKRIIKE